MSVTLAERGHQESPSQVDDIMIDRRRPLEGSLVESHNHTVGDRQRAVVRRTGHAAEDGRANDQRWFAGEGYLHVSRILNRRIVASSRVKNSMWGRGRATSPF